MKTAALTVALLSLWLLLTGCAWYGQTGPAPTLATQAAACVLVERLPASTGYLKSAAGLFRAWGATTNTAPDAAEVRAALAALPNARLTAAEQSALWAATVLAYEGAQKACRTPADFAALKFTLLRIGDALSAAVALCGPTTIADTPARNGAVRAAATTGPACDAQGLFDLSRTIRKDLK